MEKKKTEQRRRQTIRQKKSWLWEFSKKVVVMCVILHAAVFLYAAVVMWKMYDTSALSTLVSESSEIMRVCVFGYFAKAGLENWQKIGRTRKDADADQRQKEEVG